MRIGNDGVWLLFFGVALLTVIDLGSFFLGDSCSFCVDRCIPRGLLFPYPSDIMQGIGKNVRFIEPTSNNDSSTL
jgi:hypothetical protein